MADPASSIITIASLSLTIIKETVKFIQEAQVIDHFIEKLLYNLADLRKLIKEVESACRHARSRDDDPSRFVREHLQRCRRRLEGVRTMVEGLASRRTNTLLQRFTLKIKSDRSRKEIEEAIEDIERLMDQIHKGISCWTLHMTSSIDRRTSEALPVQQTLTLPTELEDIIQDSTMDPPSRTFSQVETLYDHSLASPTRRTSSSTSRTRPSVSSASSRALPAQSPDTASVTSLPDPHPVKPNSDWVDFHFQITNCRGNEARIQDIRTILQHHTNASALAKSVNGEQRTPLHLAAQRGDTKLARILLDFGADINASDSEPSTILDLAVANNQREFVAFLLDNRVNETALSSRNAKKFNEMKRIIKFSESRRTSETRRTSASTARRGLMSF